MIQRFRWALLVISILSISSTHAMEVLQAHRWGRKVDAVVYNGDKLLVAMRSCEQLECKTTIKSFDNDMQQGHDVVTFSGHPTSLTPLTKTCFMYTIEDGHWGWYDSETDKKVHQKSRAYERREQLLLGGSFTKNKNKIVMLLSKSGVLETLTISKGKVRHHEISFGKGILSCAVMHSSVQRVAFVPKGSSRGFVYAADDGSITPLAEHKKNVLAITFSPDGNTVYTASDDGAMNVSDVLTGKPLKSMVVCNNSAGAYLHEDQVVPMDLDDGDNSVFSVAHSPCGRFLATVDAGNLVKIWDEQTAVCVKELTLPRAVHSCSWHGILQCLFKPGNSELLVYNNSDRVVFDFAKVRIQRLQLSKEERVSILGRVVDRGSVLSDEQSESIEEGEGLLAEALEQPSKKQRAQKQKDITTQEMKSKNIVTWLQNREIGN